VNIPRIGSTSLIAEERLKLILVQDRSMPPLAKFAHMKEDFIGTIGNYFEINKANMLLIIKRESKKTVLETIVPILSVKRKIR
jgi:septum formation topological specificity factor MinE